MADIGCPFVRGLPALPAPDSSKGELLTAYNRKAATSITASSAAPSRMSSLCFRIRINIVPLVCAIVQVQPPLFAIVPDRRLSLPFKTWVLFAAPRMVLSTLKERPEAYPADFE